MSLCQIRIQRQSLVHCFPGLALALPKGKKAALGLAKAGPGQPYPGRRIAGIQLNRLLVIAYGLVQISVAVPVVEKTPLQVSMDFR